MAVLKEGSSGPDVTALQNTLRDLGFDPKGLDGNFGPGTKSALIAFQKSKGLTADGVAGPATLAALQTRARRTTDDPGSAPVNAESSAPVGANAGKLNLAALKGLLPDSVIAQIPETAQKFNITSNLRLAHFLAQCALESGEFKKTVEGLRYSSGERIVKIFKKYFNGVDPAPYVNNAAKLGNRVYANRMGNGNEASGDGFKFCGRGYIQLTGKDNYTSFTKFIGKDCIASPDLVATTYPLASAGFYFDSNNIWPICDRGSSDATVREVSIAVNGKNPHAVPERTAYFKKFFKALTQG